MLSKERVRFVFENDRVMGANDAQAPGVLHQKIRNRALKELLSPARSQSKKTIESQSTAVFAML